MSYVVADSSVLVAALKTLPEFLHSRKTTMSITMTVKGKRLTVTAANADEAMRVVDRFLDD
jgi:Effector Associated Constant Component 1